ATKYWLGLDKPEPVQLTNLYRDLNRQGTQTLNQRLADASVTLLQGDSLIRAINYNRRTAIISVGVTELSEFQHMLEWRFDNHMHYILSANATADDVAAVATELGRYSQVIVALHDNRTRPQSTYNYNSTVRLFINELASGNAIFCIFANPYGLAGLPGIEQAKSILVCYQNDDIMQRAAAKVILKRLTPSGRLPVTVNAFFRYGDGK